MDSSPQEGVQPGPFPLGGQLLRDFFGAGEADLKKAAHPRAGRAVGNLAPALARPEGFYSPLLFLAAFRVQGLQIIDGQGSGRARFTDRRASGTRRLPSA